MKNRIRIFMMALVTGMAPAHILRADPDSVRVRPFQISLITPLGTNGLQSWNTVNRLSLNLIAGYAHGVRGIEVAGFANVLGGDMNGLQLAGFANVATDTVTGVQGAGFANVTVGNARGIQASGFANLCTETFEGMQVSGFLNYADTLRGVQLGVVNLSDTVERGVPIGIFSWVRHGYKVIQLSANETLYGEVSFKTGTRPFHTIFTVGSTFMPDRLKWGWGFGIGTILPLGRRIDAGLEVVSYHLNDGYAITWHLNSLNRMNLSVCYNLTRHLGIFAGASFNVLVTGDGYGEIWWHHSWNPDVTAYPGLCGGIRVGW